MGRLKAEIKPPTVMMTDKAIAKIGLSIKKLAIDTIRTIIASGFEHYDWIKRDPDLENIRKEPEYIELMKGK